MGRPRRGIPLCKMFFFIIYRWHWGVIFCNFEGNFRDVPPEAIAHLLLGIDISEDQVNQLEGGGG
jgi:hypothetical protein